MLRYAISDGQFPLGHQAGAPTRALRIRLLTQAEFLASQQVDFFLLREPGLPIGHLATLSREILRLFAQSPTRLLLHGRADLALATQAHGIHLPSTPGIMTPNQVRTLYAHTGLQAPVVSLSCHTAEDLRRARTLSPDLILFGPVFGKTVAGQLVTPPAGLSALRHACHQAAPIAVLALGGVAEANIPACLEAGAAGIAAIRLFQTAQLK